MCSSVPPRYQGVRGLTLTTLSPSSALIGMKWTFERCRSRANSLEIGTDLREDFLAVVDEVHLVHGNDYVRNRKQRSDERMPPRLRQHAFARIDQHDGKLRGGRAGRHVARVLLMPGRVGDDELALRRREVPIRDIDRDSLLAFGLQAVGEQREVDRARRNG